MDPAESAFGLPFWAIRDQVEVGGLPLDSMFIQAYFGPETSLPIASLVVGLAGAVMVFGRRCLRAGKRAWRKLVRR